MINVNQLTYTYPSADRPTLHALDFKVEEGEIFGFLGPSGAGKSTTQNILIGLLKGYEGEISVMGKELSAWGPEYYEAIGVSFELPNHYLKLTARENLNYFRALYSKETATPEEVLSMVGLIDDIDKKVSDFSKGMKIRLNVARSLIHRPKILFLDEPTSGLDPVNARKIKDLTLSLRETGTTIFVTTHNMTVADELCDRIGFITAGKINLIDAPTTLKKRFGERKIGVEYLNLNGDGPTGGPKYEEFPLDQLGENDAFLRLLKTAGRIETIHTQETTLEKIFIEVTGQELTA